MKCDNCSIKTDDLEDIFCEDCTGSGWAWCANVCKKCYEEENDLRIFLEHQKDAHTAIDIV